MINIRPGPGPITSWTWDHKMGHACIFLVGSVGYMGNQGPVSYHGGPVDCNFR